MAKTKEIRGVLKLQRFAYLHKRDSERFGLLEAVDYRNARCHLGSAFRIRQVWLTFEEVQKQSFDRDRRWAIVAKVFGMPRPADPHRAIRQLERRLPRAQ